MEPASARAMSQAPSSKPPKTKTNQRRPVENGNRPTLISAVPWLIALIGLAVPFVGGGGAGWIYVVGWLVVLVGIALLKPMRFAHRGDRSSSAAITACVLVVPGLIVGGLYLVPAALAWLVIEIKVPLRGGSPDL
jgi:hypothetical protein